MDKNLLNDDRLVSLHRQKRINAFFTFYKRYRNYGYAIIQKYISKNKKYANLEEEKDAIVYLSINECIENYDESKGTFRTLLSKIIEHKTLNLIKDYNKDPLANYISIDVTNKDNDDINIVDTLTFADKGSMPDQEVTINEDKTFLKTKFNKKIAKMVTLKEAGFTYEEIAKKFNLSEKATRSIFYRIRKEICKDNADEIK